jgi:DNA-binding protein Fis
MKAENITLGDGATLKIHMNNTLFAPSVVDEAKQIVSELTKMFPVRNRLSFDEALFNYESAILAEAMEVTGGNREKAAVLLGMTYRSFRYHYDKTKQVNLLGE